MKVTVAGVPVELFGVEVSDADVIALGSYSPQEVDGSAFIAGREYAARAGEGLRVFGLPAPLNLPAPLVWEAACMTSEAH